MGASTETALGMIETRGLVPAIEAADAMVKTAEVRIVAVEQTVAALITIHVYGETAAVQTAVDAGRAAAERIGQVLSAHVIPRPDPDIRALVEAEAREAPGKSPSARSTAIAEKRASGGKRSTPHASPGDLGAMTVRELRELARNTPGFPLQGREIAMANKQQLIDLLSGDK